MSHARVSQVSLTVTTVKVFIETIQHITEANLWEELQAYLKENGKTDMFFDHDVFFLLREMAERDPRIASDHPQLYKILKDHDDHDRSRFTKPSSEYESE